MYRILRYNDKTSKYIQNYRILESQKSKIDKEVFKLIKDGIVEQPISEYNFYQKKLYQTLTKKDGV